MKANHKIIAASILSGIALWVADAFVDSIFFSVNETFTESLLTEISVHELYFRSFFIVSFIVFGLIIARKVKKRQELESQLLQAKGDWEETFNSITDLITIHDKDFNIIHANTAAEKTLGLTSASGPGSVKCYTCYHGKAAAPDDCPSCKSFSTGEPSISEMFEPHLNKYVEIRTMPRLDSKKVITGLIHIVRDITEKKELQQFLVESEERFSSLFNHASDSILLLDPDHENGLIIIDANEAAAKMHGYALDEIIGQPVSFLEAPGPHAQDPSGRIQAIMSGQQRTFEVMHMRKDGSLFPVEVSARMTVIGGKAYIIGIDRDISRRKEVEVELTRHREQLMGLVEERTAELSSMNQRLLKEIEERKHAESEVVRAGHLAALGELAAGVAHEINNPINGIINYSQILANRNGPESKEYEIAVRIMKEGDRIAGIVKSLLSFARDGKEGKHPVHIRGVLSDSLALTEAHLIKDGIHLRVTIPEDLPAIFAQSQQIEQVFLNIISNSRYSLNKKYSGAHPDKLLAITGEKVVKDEAPFVRITFHDRGTGIPGKLLDKVMNPFFTTKSGREGTGLGLSISHGIIHDHGGVITLQSVDGEYTTVTIDLPVKTENEHEVNHVKSSREIMSG